MTTHHSETTHSLLLISIAVFGLLQLKCVLLFWSCHLRHHLNHPVYRIRHPKFWIFCMALSSIQVTWKAIITYLRIRNQISVDFYQFLNQCGVLLMGCAFIARGFVLWYTVRFQQREETLLFEKVLGSENTSTELKRQLTKNYEDAFLYRHEKHMSNPLRVFAYLQTLYVFLYMIGGLLTFCVNSKVSQYYLVSVVLLFWFILACLVYTVWRSGYKIRYDLSDKDSEINTRFLDHFNFRWEITIIWLDVFIFVPLRSFFAIHYKVHRNTEYANDGLILLSFCTLLSQLFPVLAQIILPFWTYKKCKKSSAFSRCSDNAHDITVFDVLSDKHGLFLFINHAVQELNLENISCLIAIFQFKYTKTSRNEWIFDKKTRSKSNTSVASQTDGEIHDIHEETVSIEIKYSESPSADIFNVKFFASELLKLPWIDVPFAESLSNAMDTKYIQAQKIYNKFFSMGSIYSVNISAASRDFISDAFRVLAEKYENDKLFGESLLIQQELSKVFDIALPDLWENLTDMMFRFRASKGFKTLSAT